jgi:hypothetical protein
VLLNASNRRLEGWGSLVVGGPVELVIWRSVSPLETAPMWVSPTQVNVSRDRIGLRVALMNQAYFKFLFYLNVMLFGVVAKGWLCSVLCEQTSCKRLLEKPEAFE